MKKSALSFALLTVACGSAFAQLNIPSDGSDNALVVASNTVIDLRQAVTGVWSDNNTANAGKGIYDSNKWAVVFKYSSVTVSNGATLNFTNHPSHAPVVWLVTGNVTINGTVNLDGQSLGNAAPQLAEPGPGGFRGGTGSFALGVQQGSGFGPGGGLSGGYGVDWADGGNYGTRGTSQYSRPGDVYGNPSLLPLIGGSGGGGYVNAQCGAGGGGAILIATPGTITVAGSIHANGGTVLNDGRGGGGSGGGIRLVAGNLIGAGSILCVGGGVNSLGGLGRIRIERVATGGSLTVNPDPSVVPLQPSDTPLIWLPDNGPTARIVSIGALSAPADPRASFGTYGPDVTLPLVTNTTVVVETANAETASVVLVRVTPRANGNYTEIPATLTQTNSLNPLVLRWTASVPVSNGYSSVIARVIRP